MEDIQIMDRQIDQFKQLFSELIQFKAVPSISHLSRQERLSFDVVGLFLRIFERYRSIHLLPAFREVVEGGARGLAGDFDNFCFITSKLQKIYSHVLTFFANLDKLLETKLELEIKAELKKTLLFDIIEELPMETLFFSFFLKIFSHFKDSLSA